MNEIERAIEDCKNKIDEYRCDYKCWIKECEVEETKLKALEKQLNNGWIPVLERLPEDYIKVLTCDKKGNMHIMTHSSDYKYPFCISPDHPRYHMPIAWMPLPKKYKTNIK